MRPAERAGSTLSALPSRLAGPRSPAAGRTQTWPAASATTAPPRLVSTTWSRSGSGSLVARPLARSTLTGSWPPRYRVVLAGPSTGSPWSLIVVAVAGSRPGAGRPGGPRRRRPEPAAGARGRPPAPGRQRRRDQAPDPAGASGQAPGGAAPAGPGRCRQEPGRRGQERARRRRGDPERRGPG